MNILILQGHPDTGAAHLCHALALAYAEGARAGGHAVRTLTLADTGVRLLRSRAEWEGEAKGYVKEGQEAIGWADHIVLVFPLWLGGMPALVKAWLEQVFRGGFAMEASGQGWTRKLKGKSARIVVTMGMPAFFYRLYFRSHGTRELSRSILGFSGIGPVRESLVGRVEPMDPARADKLLEEMRDLGREGR